MNRFYVALSAALMLGIPANPASVSVQQSVSPTTDTRADMPPATGTIGPALAQRDWAATAPRSLGSASPDKAEIAAFLLAQLKLRPEEASVCSAGFFLLDGDAAYSLVASMDYSGRHFCNEVAVIQKRSDGFSAHRLGAWEVDDVKDIVRDLDPNGGNILVVPTPYSAYDGFKCVAIWSRIYAREGDTLVDRSREFTDFYKKRLEALHAKRVQAGAANATCEEMEADRIERFLGTSPTAGFDTARAWIASTDQSLRLKGVAVLADIGDRQSRAILARLTGDASPILADAAKNALASSPNRE